MHYYLYEIKNNVNNKVYVGVHKAKSLDDGYMGSGKIIISAIQKYGRDNFTKTILEFFDNQEEMFKREKEFVDEEFLSRDDTYNLKRGGCGGFDFINNSGQNYTAEKNKEITPFGTKEFIENSKKEKWASKGGVNGAKICEERKVGFFCDDTQKELTARSQTSAAKRKRKETMANINHSVGEKNSQFGTMWITDGNKNAKIKKSESLPDGWVRGRI